MTKIILTVLIINGSFLTFGQDFKLTDVTWWVVKKEGKTDIQLGDVYEMFPDSSNRISLDTTMYCQENLFFNNDGGFKYTLKCTPMIPKKNEPHLNYSNTGTWKMIDQDFIEITMMNGHYNETKYIYKVMKFPYDKIQLCIQKE